MGTSTRLDPRPASTSVVKRQEADTGAPMRNVAIEPEQVTVMLDGNASDGRGPRVKCQRSKGVQRGQRHVYSPDSDREGRAGAEAATRAAWTFGTGRVRAGVTEAVGRPSKPS